MGSYVDELTQSFWNAYPADFIEESMRLYASDYRTAYDECAAFYPWEEAHDLRPHARRAKIEARLRDLANTYPGLSATVEPNITKTSYHTRIVSGNVILTESHVGQPSEMVRWAEFRNTYARSPQYHFFEEDAPPPEGGYLYAILLHGESKRNPKRPDFMRIAFPDAECKSYLYQIDLFAIPRFKALANELWPVQAEAIRDDLKLNLRSDAKKKKKKEEDGEE